MNFILILSCIFTVALSERKLIFKNRPPLVQPYVIDGLPTELGQFPYVVAVKSDNNLCSGVIIGEYWVLTAAHCKTSSAYIVAGSIDTAIGGQMYQIKEFITHPKYKQLSFDIAIIVLKKRLTFSKLINKLPLNQSVIKDKLNVDLAGFGKSKHDEDEYGKLFHAKLTTVDQKTCESVLRVNNDQMCAIGITGIPCSGDSGSPLVYNNSLIGILIYGASTVCHDNYPDAYERISSHYEWINSVIKK
ncbi:trypsin 5G1-like [Phlebotomus argentipes]|uniref:trypsin 5G1-like n=1 Tax=Phlebotomus argentipes TaxID=94469 RepID=UPI0028931CFD|nr:trypsin 5G1-like [Phlebotomus argentipes]